MNRKRYYRRNPSFGRIALTFLVIIAMAILSGYGLTKYIIQPYFFGTSKEKPVDEEPTIQEFQGSSIIIDRQNGNNDEEKANTDSLVNDETDTPVTEPTTGIAKVLYSIQYGSFSDRTGAEEMETALVSAGIPVTIIEKEGAFKLIGMPFLSKDEARKSLEKTKKEQGDEPFITELEVRIR